MTEPLLAIDNLSVSYNTRAGSVPVLRNVSLSITPGETLGLVGESGCGKSTLAMSIVRHLSGRGRIEGGSMLFKGQDLVSARSGALRAIRGSGIGMVFQDAMSALNPSIPIGTQLAEGPVAHHGIGWREARLNAAEMLREVRLPDPARVMAAYPHQLSGGQQQRVVIAMALLMRPALLICDEPTTSLDVTVEAGIVDLIADLRRKTSMSLLFISHNLGLVAETCDRLAVMYAGEIVEEGRVADVFRAPAHPYTQGLIRCIPTLSSDKRNARLRPIAGTVAAPGLRGEGCVFVGRCEHAVPGRCDLAPIPLSFTAPDQKVRCVRSDEIAHSVLLDPPIVPVHEPESAPFLLARDLSKSYPIDDRTLMGMILREPVKHVRANRRLNFEAGRHRTLAIVGESGCGKSTFARILSGLEIASGGALLLDDKDVGQIQINKRSADLKRSLQMIFQNPDETLNPSYSVERQIARAARKLGGLRDKKGLRERVTALLGLTRLPAELATKMPRQLSGGQKQRVAIARAFAGRPSLVIADEPVSALDVSVRAAVTELLLDIQAEQGTTLILISHDLGLVRYMADRVVVMYLGQVMEVGTTDAVFSLPMHPYTAALLAAVPEINPDPLKPKLILSGEIPSTLNPPSGCPFSTRCPMKVGPICDAVNPELRAVTGVGDMAACHRPEFQEAATVAA